MNEFTGIQHPTHRRKAAMRKRLKRSRKRLNLQAKRHTKTKEN